MFALLKRISIGVAKLTEINTASLVLTLLFGVIGVIFAVLSYQSDRAGNEHVLQPFNGESAFFIEENDGSYFVDKSATKNGGFMEIFFCQQGIGMGSLLSMEYPERPVKQSIPDVDWPNVVVQRDIPVSYLVHIWTDDEMISSVFHTFDLQQNARLRSEAIEDEHIVCTDTY